MKQIEIEYKTLLSKKEFENLTQKFSTVPLITQTNHYFDTKTSHLRKAKLSLRIRTFSDHAEMTLKIPQEVGNMEHNIPLSLEDAEQMIKRNKLKPNAITQLLEDSGFKIDSIVKKGDLTTHRRETLLPIGLMALDENHYSGIVDYELELEVSDPDQGKHAFEQFLAQEQIDFKYAKSKVARFTQSILKDDA
ncbi:CYTH domain-containing protein [Streptococcus moroccensis]|uniref:Uncharacterized protein YjbK n=1 Tax=Streptococcus moroccensis TaxID=1451356 RepID=A0ABT9YU76_9STRE|nr:CYTH domain-containing protein [Streptococcus moroccensis]MDQ0223546.1 uncharacterized protein YjbK [Streptococcus moroccensis]